MGILAGLLLAAAQSVAGEPVALRDGCGEKASTVHMLRRGDRVEIRYGIAGEGGTCYRVTVESGGASYEGWMPAAGIGKAEEFERERSAAAGFETKQTSREDAEAVRRAAGATAGNQPVSRAAELLRDNRPGEALRLLEAALRAGRRDAGTLAIAGVAASRADRPKDAIRYWEESLALSPEAAVERLLEQARREVRADASAETLYGTRFALRYDPAAGVTVEQARLLVAVLDREFARIAEQLGCRAEERITAVIQSRQAYLESTGAAEWSGGSYDGRIRVAMLEASPGEATRRALAHEVVHACLARLGSWPAWLHEGLAQKLSGEQLSGPQRAALGRLAAQGRLPRLGELEGGYSGWNGEQAAMAYAAALGAVESLYGAYGADGVRSLLQNPARLAEAARDLDRRMAAWR